MSAHTTPAVRSTRKPALPALTGIRIFLALSIVFFHFTPAHLGLLYPVIDNGYIFVGFFFLLSGFILAYNYAERGATLSKRDFWIARFSRLYPVYLFSMLLFAPLFLLEFHYQTRAHFWQGMVLTPLLLQGWSPLLATFGNTVAWTLSCEAMLYAAFPWLIRVRWPRTPGRLIALTLGVWAVGMSLPVMYLYLNPDGLPMAAGHALANRYSPGLWLRALKFTPLPYVTTFLVGTLLGLLQNSVRISKQRRLAIAVAGLLLTTLYFYVAAPHVSYVLMHGGLLIPLFSCIVFGLSGDHIISAIFAWRPLVILGETTYCLYLLHFDAYNLIHKYSLPQRLHVEQFDPWVSYAAIMLLAVGAYFLIEVPGRKFVLNRWATKRKP